MIYQKQFQVLSSEVDMHRRMRLSALFTHLQESAIAHTQALGAGREKTLDRGLLWIVTQQTVAVNRLPAYDETLLLESWPGKTMHLYFPRYWRILDDRGGCLIEASSLWALMDQNSRHLAFPEEYDIAIEDMSGERPSALPKRIKAQPAPALQEFTVPYSYVDLNGHMNNTRYFDLAADHLPPDLSMNRIREIRAEYTGEAALRETMTLHALSGADSWYFSGEADGRTVFRILLSFHPQAQTQIQPQTQSQNQTQSQHLSQPQT